MNHLISSFYNKKDLCDLENHNIQLTVNTAYGLSR